VVEQFLMDELLSDSLRPGIDLGELDVNGATPVCHPYMDRGVLLGQNMELAQEGAFERLTHDNFHLGNVVVMKVCFDEYEHHNDPPGSLKRVGDHTGIQK
jgi:hypothetical protein